MNEKDKIESRIRAILSVKKIKEGLDEEETITFEKLEKKFRDNEGKLIKGAFYISAESKWVIA